MRALAVGVAAALLVLAPGVPAMPASDAPIGANVDILFGAVAPAQVNVVAGDAVEWTNGSVRTHTVTDDGGAFDSGSLTPGTKFSHVYSGLGAFSYHCRLHPYIRGQVDVYRLLLDVPAASASSGRPFPLSGRAALPVGAPVAIELDPGDGNWQHVADTSVNPDGTFDASITPTASGSYRALAGADASPPVQLLVLDRSVAASARAIRGGTRVSLAVTPASPGQTVVLQLRLKERFGWWPVAQKRLDKSSRASFTLRGSRRVAARVVLTLPDGATALATSATLRVRTASP